MEDRNDREAFTMDKLKYVSTEKMYVGVLVEITDASVTIDIKGRKGQIKIPRRMLISEYDLILGQEVGFMMSYPEVLFEEPNPKYVNAINAYTEHKKAIQAATNDRNAEDK